MCAHVKKAEAIASNSNSNDLPCDNGAGIRRSNGTQRNRASCLEATLTSKWQDERASGFGASEQVVRKEAGVSSVYGVKRTFGHPCRKL